jgi:hypothetical protein
VITTVSPANWTPEIVDDAGPETLKNRVSVGRARVIFLAVESLAIRFLILRF